MRLLWLFYCCAFVFGWLYTWRGVQGQCPSYAPKQGYRLYGHVIFWLYAEKEVLCKLKCNIVQGCLTFNYEPATEICELNDANHTLHTGDLQQAPGFVYVDVKKQKKLESSTPSPTVPGSESPIRSHHSTGYYCVQPKSGDCSPVESKGTHTLIFKIKEKLCSAEMMKFTFDSDGIIRHKCSGKIVCPEGNYPHDSQRLLLMNNCPKNVSMHRRLPSKSLQNKINGACVHPRSGRPEENVELVYQRGCNGNKLVFNFFKLPAVEGK